MERRRTSGQASGGSGSSPNGYESHSGGELSVLDVLPLRARWRQFPTVSDRTSIHFEGRS